MKKKKIIVLFVFCFMLLSAVFLNKGEAQAAGNYSIQINKGTNVVTVFRSNGTPERAFVCSTGYATPIGTFYTSQKLRWHVLDGPSYGQYCTRITGSILFHSVWYYGNGDYASQSYREYNKLGTTASHGCVRLTVADAKWIYENCPLQTRVTVIYGSSANDPLGKPEAIKIPPNYGSRGWDPTDPMPGNPYSNLRPSIDVNNAPTQIGYGSPFNAYTGISARDSLGNDITAKLTCSGSVNTYQLGSYQVSYAVTDALGRNAYADVIYNVVDTVHATISGVIGSQTKEYNSKLDLRSNVSASTIDQKNLTSKIKIKIVYPKTKTEKLYKKNVIKLNKLGTYKINYYVTNPNNGLMTKVTGKVLVKDTKKPKLSGVSSKKTLEYNSVKNLMSGVKAKLVSGKNVTSKIVVKIKVPGKTKYTKLSSKKYKKYKFNKLGTYKVEYSVANPYNKKAVTKKVTTITVRDTKKPKLSGVSSKKTLEYKSKLNLRSGVTAKLVSGKNMTSKIVIKVKVPGSQKFKTLKTADSKKYYFTKVGVYTVEYSVANPYNKKAVAKKNMKVTVKDTKPPVISGVSNKNVALGDSLDLRAGVKAKLKSGTSVTSAISISVTTPAGKTSKWTGKKYTFDQVGNYKVVYTATNPNSKKSAKKTMTVKVTDKRTPKITIASNKVRKVEAGTSYEVYAGVTATLSDNSPLKATASITGKDGNGQTIKVPAINKNGIVVFRTVGTYTITYKAVNTNNNKKAEKSITVKVTAVQEPQITIASNKVLEVEAGTSYEVYAGVTAVLPDQTTLPVTASITGKDENDQTIKVPAINKNGIVVFRTVGTYTITYKAVNTNNNKKAEKSITVKVTAVQEPQITIASNKVLEVEAGTSYEVYAGVTAVLPDQTILPVTASMTGVDSNNQPLEVPVIGEDGKVLLEMPGTYTITYTAVNPNNGKEATASFTVTVKAKEVQEPENGSAKEKVSDVLPVSPDDGKEEDGK